MINLLTLKQKESIKKEFILRLAAVILLLVSLTLLNYLAYVIPYYISVQKKNAIVSEQFKSVIGVENKENAGENVLKVVRSTIDKMSITEAFTKQKKTLSENILSTVSIKNSKISFSKIAANYLSDKEMLIVINGHSVSRDALTSFVEDLNKSGIFYSVEYPVSDLAKSADIDFTINIKAKI